MSKKQKVLGIDIFIPGEAVVFENGGYVKKTYLTETIEILIGIGKDHTATLIMEVEAWKALKKIRKVDITTFKQE